MRASQIQNIDERPGSRGDYTVSENYKYKTIYWVASMSRRFLSSCWLAWLAALTAWLASPTVAALVFSMTFVTGLFAAALPILSFMSPRSSLPVVVRWAGSLVVWEICSFKPEKYMT